VRPRRAAARRLAKSLLQRGASALGRGPARPRATARPGAPAAPAPAPAATPAPVDGAEAAARIDAARERLRARIPQPGEDPE
jgi:hypothetical protein